jgi:hypothetical protein
MGLDYANGKLGVLVDSLAADIRPLPERLERVSSTVANVIDDARQHGYLPDVLLARLSELRWRLTNVKADGGEGSVAATLDVMHPDDAHEIAVELVALTTEIRSLKGEPEEADQRPRGPSAEGTV